MKKKKKKKKKKRKKEKRDKNESMLCQVTLKDSQLVIFVDCKNNLTAIFYFMNLFQYKLFRFH